MKYNEMVIGIPSASVQMACDIADMLDFGGIYVEDYSDLEENEIVKQVGIVDEELLKKDKTTAVLHIYIGEDRNREDCTAYICERFSAAGITYAIEWKTVDEEDYANCWKKYYKPFTIGKIAIVPEWEEYSAAAGETVLKINPGMAFGTGTHETTSMCVEALQDYVKSGDELLDVGCGSGVLSATALLLGANKATALDIDCNAVKVAVENVSLNNVNGEFEAYCDNILDENSDIRNKLDGKKFNVIVANIVADIIIALSSFISEYLASDGCFIVSGIITERENDVLAALTGNGFEIIEVRHKKGWTCICTRRAII